MLSILIHPLSQSLVQFSSEAAPLGLSHQHLVLLYVYLHNRGNFFEVLRFLTQNRSSTGLPFCSSFISYIILQKGFIMLRIRIFNLEMSRFSTLNIIDLQTFCVANFCTLIKRLFVTQIERTFLYYV